MAEKKKVRTFIVIPKDMYEVYEMLPDMRGTQADLVRVAIMSYQLGYNDGLDKGGSDERM
jgi:hypothetical protein